MSPSTKRQLVLSETFRPNHLCSFLFRLLDKNYPLNTTLDLVGYVESKRESQLLSGRLMVGL